MARTYEELLADLRSGLDKKPDYESELPERFRTPRPPKPPPEPTVEDRSFLEEALARVRGTVDVRQPDAFGERYLDQPAPVPVEKPNPALIQKATEDEIAAGAKDVAAKGGDVEEYVSRLHELKYGKRIASLLKAGRSHATKLLREGAKPEEAEAGGLDLAEKHIRNLEAQIAAGEQQRDAQESGDAYQGLIEGFTTRKGLARHALTTGAPMIAAGIAAGPLGWGTLATAALTAGVTTAGVAAAEKFIDDKENVDWKSATVEGLANIIPVPVVESIAHGAVSKIANPLVRRAVATGALAATEAIEEPVQAVAAALTKGEEIPSGYSLGAEAAAGGILGGALGGAVSIMEQAREDVSDTQAGATEIEAAPPVRAAGRLAGAAADAQLGNIETALGEARRAGDLGAIQALEQARQEILDAKASGSEKPVSGEPPAPGEAGPPSPPSAPPPGVPPAAPPGVPPAPPPTEAGPPPGPVPGTTIRPQTPTESAAAEAGETSAAEDAAARQAGVAPQVRSLTEAGQAAAQGAPVPPTPPVVRGPTSGTARGVETTPPIPTPAAGRPAGPAAPPPTAAAPPPVAPVAPAAPVPARRLRVGRGANGQVEVVFPDQNHADLFAWFGRQRRGDSQKADTAGLSARLGIPPDLFGGAAIRYRDAVMDGVKGLERGATFTAPTLGDVVAGPPPPAPGALTPVGPASEALGAAVGVTVPPVAPPPAAVTPQPTEAAPTETPESLTETRPDLPHKHATTQVELGEQLGGAVQQLGREIPDELLAYKGRETNPHVTVFYGLEDETGLEKAVKQAPPARLRFGDLHVFEGVEDGTADAVVVKIESPDLARLRERIGKSGKVSKKDQREYIPHATVAYVQPGRGKEVAESLRSRSRELLGGLQAEATSVTFRSRMEEMLRFPLSGTGEHVPKPKLTGGPPPITEEEGKRIKSVQAIEGGAEPTPQPATSAAGRYYASNVGMAKGYWKVVDRESGQTIRVLQSKSVAEDVARTMNYEVEKAPDERTQLGRAIDTAIARAPEAVREELRAYVGNQRGRVRAISEAEADWDYFGQPIDPVTRQKIKNRAAKRKAAREALDSAKALYEATYETMRGLVRESPEGNAIVARLRNLIEGKGLRTPGEAIERPPIPHRAYEGVKGFVEAHPNAPTLDEAVALVKEYAKDHARSAEDVLGRLTQLAGEVASLGAAALRLEIDIPGLGQAKIAKALAAGPGDPNFDRIVAYRQEAEAHERAMHEMFAEFDDKEFVHPGLHSIADNLEEDAASVSDEEASELIRATFMGGVLDPATGEQVTLEAAVEAIRAGHGRLFSRIRTAYQDAMEAVEDDVPFDIPEGGAGPDEIQEAKRDFAYVSAIQDPFGGRYGPPPKKLTPEQLELRKKWAAKMLAAGGARAEPVSTRRAPAEAPRPEGEGAAAAERPAAGGARADVGEGAPGGGERGGRGPGVPGGVPGAARPAGEAAPAPAVERRAPAPTREGIFHILNPREEQTLKRPPRYELIPPDLNRHLSDDQKLGVAKAIEALQAGSGFLFQDGTGVGKTRQLLALAETFRRKGLKVLIVSKASAIEATKDAKGVWRASGSYADDSASMGIPIEFTKKRAVPLKTGVIALGTYHNLRDYAVDKDTVLLFDEAHMLKNAGDSEVAAAGIDLIRKAKVTGFATATPGDKAYHLLYLSTIGLLEGKPYEQAMKDLGLQAKPAKRVSKALFEKLKKQGVPEAQALEQATETFMVWKATSPTKHRRAVEALFNRLTENGTVIKREVDLSPVVVNTVIVPLGEEGTRQMQEIENAGFDRKLALMHMRRQQEPHKLARVQELIQQELGLGRQVVVFATRVNRSDVVERFKDPRTGELIERVLMSSEGTLKQLQQWLEQEGISHAEIHGGAAEGSKEAQARFQSGNAKVVIATYEKGGTGINLDDRTGAAPRTMILMTAPFDSVSIVQAIGRVHRFTTKSPSKIIMLYSDHGVDKWNAAVMGGKLAQLHAQVSGDINALDLGNTSADEEDLLAGGAHYLDVAAVMAGHGKSGERSRIFSPKHYGKIVRQLQQLGVKINLKGGDFEVKTHEGFVIVGSVEKTPGGAAYGAFTWEHDAEAGDFRLAEAVKPKPRSLAKTPEVMRVLRDLQFSPGLRKQIVSQKQYDYLHRQITSLGAAWGVPDLPGSFQIQTQDGDFFTGELTPPREGARLVFGKVVDDGDKGAFYWKRLDSEEARVEEELPGAETPISGAMDALAAEGGESLDPDFEQVGNITGVVGTPVQAPRIPVFARPELQWGTPIRLGQGTLLTPGRELRPGVSILGSSLREGFEKIGRIDWTGMVVNSLADAAALFHTARNPSLEHAVLFFVDRFGVIRGSMQATSNSPNFVSWGIAKEFEDEVLGKIDAFAAAGVKITGVIDLHNHPSTSPTPSKADERHFINLRTLLGTRYMGSAIIDHERASITTIKGRYEIVRAHGGFVDPDPFLAEGVDSAAFYRPGNAIRNDADFRRFAQGLLTQGLWKPGSTDVHVALIDSVKKVRLLTVVPEAVFKDPKTWGELSQLMLRVSGASGILAATDGGFARGLDVVGTDYLSQGLLQELIDLQTKDAAAGVLRGIGVPVPNWYNWKDAYADTSRRVRLEQTLDAESHPASAYPPWGERAPDWWTRRVTFARARMAARARGTQANAGVDPVMFWDGFVLGADAVRRGIRNFGQWLASLAKDIPGFRGWGRRVWDHLVEIGAPVVIERRGEVRPFGEAAEGLPAARPRNLQPIRTVPTPTVNDLAASVEALISGAPVDVGAGKPLGIGVPRDLAININNVVDQADIRNTMATIVRAIEKRFDLARQKFTVQELRQLALQLGYDETDYLRMVREKGALTAPEIIAGRVLRQHAGVDFANKFAVWRDASDRAKEKGLSGEEQRKRNLDVLEAERERQAALQKMIAMMYGTAAAGSEAGRALYAHKLLVSTLTPEEQFLQKLMRSKRADQQQIAALADALAKGDQAAVARILRRIHKPGFTKMLVEYFINSLLSGPPTFVANVTGNLIHEGALRTPERALAAQLEKFGIRQGVEKLLTGKAAPTERVVGEAMEALRAQVRHRFGILAALDMARQAITNEDLRFLNGVKNETYVPAIPGLFGKVVRTPGRVMEALDIGAKINAMAAERAALLWRRAYVEKGRAGLDSIEFRERLRELHALMDEWTLLEEQRLMDPTAFQQEHGAAGYTFLYRNRELAEVYKQMKAAADVSTFRDEVTRFTSFIKQMRATYPWLSFVVPFVHTTERLLVQGLRRTPLGLLKTAYNIQQGKLEGGEASDRLAQGILGTMVTAAMYTLAASGQMTGGGPDDPREREQWLKTGKLPYAIRIGDTWVSYARIEPFATIFGFAADLAEAKDEKTAGDAFGKLHYAVLNNITNKTYLEGLVSAAEAVGNPDRYMARFWKRSAGALVPNLLATAARAIDPTIRETDDLSQVLMSRVPILSEELPARLTGTGEPTVRGETGVSRFISPVRYSDEAGPEKNLERMFLETGYSPSQPPRAVTIPGTMGRRVELTRQEREIYAAYAKRATDFARSLTSRGDWSKLDAYGKEEVLKRIFRYSHDAAHRAMLASVLARMKRGEVKVVAR